MISFFKIDGIDGGSRDRPKQNRDAVYSRQNEFKQTEKDIKQNIGYNYDVDKKDDGFENY